MTTSEGIVLFVDASLYVCSLGVTRELQLLSFAITMEVILWKSVFSVTNAFMDVSNSEYSITLEKNLC